VSSGSFDLTDCQYYMGVSFDEHGRQVATPGEGALLRFSPESLQVWIHDRSIADLPWDEVAYVEIRGFDKPPVPPRRRDPGTGLDRRRKRWTFVAVGCSDGREAVFCVEGLLPTELCSQLSERGVPHLQLSEY